VSPSDCVGCGCSVFEHCPTGVDSAVPDFCRKCDCKEYMRSKDIKVHKYKPLKEFGLSEDLIKLIGG
jgi:hypothetical protein